MKTVIECEIKDYITGGANSIGTYFRKEVNGVDSFIKCSLNEVGVLSDVFASMLLGHMKNLPQEGYIKHSLCEVVLGGGSRIGCYSKYDETKEWLRVVDLLDGGKLAGELNRVVQYGSIAECQDAFLALSKILSEKTGRDIRYIKDYYFKQACLDALLFNGGRSVDNNFDICRDISTGGYELSPYKGFAMSVYAEGAYESEISSISSHLKLVDVLRGEGVSVPVIDFSGFVKEFSNIEIHYDIAWYCYMDLKKVENQFEEYKGILWEEA